MYPLPHCSILFDILLILRDDLSNLNVALKNLIGSKVMKIWLPDSLYRVKPLLLVLFGAALLYISNDFFTIGLGVFSVGYGSWIIVVRMMWSNAGTVKTRVGSTPAGEQRTHYVDTTRK
jgi:hypothetical protein